MAEFAANILKTESLYYQLSRATLYDGILHLSAGGSAETEITSVQLTNLTEYFRISYIADRYCDSYTSDIRIKVYAKSKDGNNFNYTFFPCDTEGNMFLQEFQVKATSYEKLTWRIESDVAVTVSLWELCPEAMDINAQTIIDGVQQSLPRLLYDYNTWPLTVESSEATVGLITFRLLDKTDLQGHFIMSFFASEAAILTMRFYTNEIEELFAPLTYDIRKGYNSVGIPHCYLHRSAGFYSVMATAQVSAGIVTVPTRGVLYSIDGGYLAKRELDVSIDVQDLAIRQTSISYGPDEVWLVGIDAGEILVRKRDYNEINPNVAWTPVLSLGNGIAAAMEFNGYWDFRANSMQYTIETEEEPWYFWVDSNGILWGRWGADETTLFQLDDHVSLVRACRGYKSEQYLEQDQGLVVVYLKDGIPWYCQYIWDNFNQVHRWTSPELLLNSNEQWDFVTVTRLNDYRLAFELSNSVHNIWLYTDRTYVNNSVPHENLYAPSWEDFYICSYVPVELDESLSIVDYYAELGGMTITFTLSRPIAISRLYDLHDLLSFTGLIWNKYDYDHRNTVDYVEMNVDEQLGITTFVVHLLSAITASIINIYINRNQAGWVRKRIGPELWVQSRDFLQLELNFMPPIKDTIQAPRITSATINYLGKVVRTQAAKDTMLSAQPNAANIYYRAIRKDTHSASNDEITAPTITSKEVTYIQTGISPI